MSEAVLLPASKRVVRPWKNGGGTTQDIALFPSDSGLDDFGWRLSIATVESDGVFSHFAGVDRHLAILEGALTLELEDRPAVIITADDAPIAFPGDRVAYGRVVQGPIRDLNLMVRRAAYRGSLRRASRIDAIADAQTTVLIATTRVRVEIDGTAYQLAPLDALLVTPGSRIRGGDPMIVAEIVAN